MHLSLRTIRSHTHFSFSRLKKKNLTRTPQDSSSKIWFHSKEFKVTTLTLSSSILLLFFAMADLQSLDGHQFNGGFIPPAAIVTSSEAPKTSTAASVGSKRLRRPSVRLGDIGGDQYHHHQQVTAYDSYLRRPKWRGRNQSGKASSSSRTKTLTNLSGSDYENIGGGTLDEDPIPVGSWRVKKKPKKLSGEEEEEEDEEGEGFRDFSREDSESPMKEENRRRYGEDSRNVELSGDWHSGGGGRGGREGVKIWLEELGLGRYWPMFEMHEVDEQVLPLLTLEDLKDMGINAVGSRRKMYCAIQKLGREFS